MSLFDSEDSETDCSGTVELGTPDRSVNEYDRLDPFTSRLGGEPAWLSSQPESSELKCAVCSSKLFLLVQFECFDEGDSDRILYVFGCNSKSCVIKSPNLAFKAILQTRPKKKSAKVSANFWEPCEDAEEEASKQVEISRCSHVCSDSCFPVIVLKIVDELVRKQWTTVAEAHSSEDANGNEGSSDEEPVAKEDEVMDAFLERVSHYPRQCVRYSPHGRPLHFSQKYHDSFKLSDFQCARCANEMSFQAQLMPAILSLLPIDNHVAHIPNSQRGKYAPFGDGLEYATVLVFACPNNHCVVRCELEEESLN